MLFGCFGVFSVMEQQPFYLLGIYVLLTIGMVSFILLIGLSLAYGELSYDNAEHPLRFWVLFFLGILLSLACVFFPIGGWPFLVLFVAFTLFSNQVLGVTGACLLLLMTVVIRQADVLVFSLYFLSGVIASGLFRRMDKHFKIGLPFLISQLVLMICQTIYLINTQQQSLQVGMYVIPIANCIVSSILLFVLLKWFFSHVILKYRLRYIEVLDTEGELLQAFKEKARKEFYLCMHAAHFCERIGKELRLDVEALKTAGYYQRIGVILSSDTEAPLKMPDDQGKPVIQDKQETQKGHGLQKKQETENVLEAKKKQALQEKMEVQDIQETKMKQRAHKKHGTQKKKGIQKNPETQTDKGTRTEQRTQKEQMTQKERTTQTGQTAQTEYEVSVPMSIRVDRYLTQHHFPPKVRDILSEYLAEGNSVSGVEATILVFVDAVISTVANVYTKDKTAVVDFDKLIDRIFAKGLESGMLRTSEITLAQLSKMKHIFKEEKLYYDFLR
jgi:hypothetical protein